MLHLIFRRTTAAVAFLGAAMLSPAMAVDWYVDGAQGNDDQAGTVAAPLRTVWRAWTNAKPGDAIHLLPTALYGPVYLGGKSGEPGNPITLRGSGLVSNPTRISGMGRNFGIMIDVDTNHVRLRNLDVTAPGAGLRSGWSAIHIKNSHHIEVLDNSVHDAGCSGIQTHGADYVTITGNTVYSNAKDTTNYVYCSGISLLRDRDIDTNTGIKMVVARNIVFGNTNVPMPDCGTRCGTADGNGIIVDDSRHAGSDRNAYRGAYLIENNVIFGNGGKGVHLYQSDNVTVRSNTLYNNNRDPFHQYANAGEINLNNAAGVNIYSNIAFADGVSTHPAISVQHGRTAGAPVNIDHNLVFNAKNGPVPGVYTGGNTSVAVNIGAGNRWGNPLFRRPSLDPALADFRTASDSPARQFAMHANHFADRDVLGVSRFSPDQPQNWVPIIREGAAFAVGGMQTVRYGSGNRWVQQAVAESGQCTNAFFGNDPLFGTVKQCQLLISLPAATSTGTWTPVAKEGSGFSVAGVNIVRYGNRASWIQKTVVNHGQCTNSYFGKDPLPGVVKQCELMVGPPPRAAASWSTVAAEGAAFFVTGSQTVRYGIGSGWIEKSITGNAECTNAFFGKDPQYGVRKRCDVLSPMAPAPSFNLRVFAQTTAPIITAGAYQLPF